VSIITKGEIVGILKEVPAAYLKLFPRIIRENSGELTFYVGIVWIQMHSRSDKPLVLQLRKFRTMIYKVIVPSEVL
jgi:hypothetical protein